MNINDAIVCPKCRKPFLKKALGKPKLGLEYYCHFCHIYMGLNELVEKWGYDLGDFGDCFPLAVYNVIDKKNSFSKNNGRHPWINLPIMRDWDNPEEDKAWAYLSELIATKESMSEREKKFNVEWAEMYTNLISWWNQDTVSPIDEPTWANVVQRQEAYEMVDRMFLGTPEYAEYEEGCGNHGIDIGVIGYPI